MGQVGLELGMSLRDDSAARQGPGWDYRHTAPPSTNALPAEVSPQLQPQPVLCRSEKTGAPVQLNGKVGDQQGARSEEHGALSRKSGQGRESEAELLLRL